VEATKHSNCRNPKNSVKGSEGAFVSCSFCFLPRQLILRMVSCHLVVRFFCAKSHTWNLHLCRWRQVDVTEGRAGAEQSLFVRPYLGSEFKTCITPRLRYNFHRWQLR
jgi:hypothetical protein